MPPNPKPFTSKRRILKPLSPAITRPCAGRINTSNSNDYAPALLLVPLLVAYLVLSGWGLRRRWSEGRRTDRALLDRLQGVWLGWVWGLVRQHLGGLVMQRWVYKMEHIAARE